MPRPGAAALAASRLCSIYDGYQKVNREYVIVESYINRQLKKLPFEEFLEIKAIMGYNAAG